MLSVCLKHELKQLWRSPALRLWLIALWLLAALALWSQSSRINAYRQTQTDVSVRQQEVWNNQGELNAHTAAHHGLYAFKPWRALSIWEPGLHPVLGNMVFLEAHRQNTAEGYAQSSDSSRFAPLSLAALFQILVPLALIVLAYAQISAERESGTLKMLYLHGCSPMQLGLAKMLALTLALLLMVGPVISIGLGPLLLNGNISWARLGSFLLLYAFYWLIFIVLSLALSSLTQSRYALLLLLGFWALNTLLIPRSAMTWQNVIQPLPSRGAFETQIQAELDALPDWYTRQDAIQARLLREQGVKDPKALSVNLEGMVLKESERDESAIYQRHFQALYQHYAQASHNYRRWGWLFPALAVQSLSQALTESDFFHHLDFLKASEAYRQDFIYALNQSIAAHPEREAFEYKAQNSFWQSIQSFDYQGLSLKASLSPQKSSLLALLLWALGSLIFFIFSVGRTKVIL